MTTTQQPSTALAIIDPRHVPLATQVFGEDRLQLLAELVGRGWKVPPTPTELEAIALICSENRWDIFARPAQVHFVKRWDSKLGKEVMTPQTSIDGMRLSASRSRDYLGPAGYQWCGDDGVWKDVWLSPDPPRAARAGVYRRGHREPMYAVALWDEWVQMQDVWVNSRKTGEQVVGPFWQSKPAHMLAKTAEMIVLKQAFPAETNELEIAHLEELHRLEMPARAAEYDRVYGADEAHAFAEMPAYTAPRERTDLEDLPRQPEVTQQAPPPVVEQPQPQPRKLTRGDLLEQYSVLLTQARNDGVVDDESVAQWVLRADLPDVGIIAKGQALRALVNQATLTRAAASSEDGPQPPDPEPAAARPKVEMVTVRSQLYAKMTELVEEAARLEVDFDDCKVVYPAPKEDVLRKIEKLEERIQSKKDRLAGITPGSAPPEQAELEDIPF